MLSGDYQILNEFWVKIQRPNHDELIFCKKVIRIKIQAVCDWK
jgi:hypothetical protein